MNNDDFAILSTCSVLLASLHAAGRLLIRQREDAKSEGIPTVTLERALDANREATRNVLSYLSRVEQPSKSGRGTGSLP